MATQRKPIGRNVTPESGVFPDRIGNQITAATAPSIGSQLALVLADGGSDEGIYLEDDVPKGYVGSPVIIIKGILDGAPGASDTLGFGVRGKSVDDNESADGTYNAEDANSVTIGSNGLGYSDEDQIEISVSISNITFSEDETMSLYIYLDSSGTTYTGNFILRGINLQYSDS